MPTAVPLRKPVPLPLDVAGGVAGARRAAGLPRPAGVPGAPDCTVLTDPILLGRGALLAELVDRARLGRHTLLVGGEGLGKTRLLEELAAVAAGRRVLLDADAQRVARRRYVELPQAPEAAFTVVYVAEAGPATRLTDALAQALHHLGLLALPDVPPELRAGACAELTWKEVKRKLPTAVERERAVVESLHDLAAGGRAPRLLLLLDGLDRAGAPQARFLTLLQQRATVVGAVRSVPPSPALRTFFATFGQLRIPPLEKPHGAALFEYFVSRYGVACQDERHYEREVLRRAEGNPATLRAMMFEGAQGRLVTSQNIRDLQQRDDAPFLNMGLVYVFGLIGLGAARILMIGVRNTDLYIVLTVATVVGYLVFRVWRGFFVWQPQPDSR